MFSFTEHRYQQRIVTIDKYCKRWCFQLKVNYPRRTQRFASQNRNVLQPFTPTRIKAQISLVQFISVAMRFFPSTSLLNVKQTHKWMKCDVCATSATASFTFATKTIIDTMGCRFLTKFIKLARCTVYTIHKRTLCSNFIVWRKKRRAPSENAPKIPRE